MNFLKNILMLAFIFAGSHLSGQDIYVLCNDYAVTIHGSSNLHDWVETVGKVTGRGNIIKNNNGSFDLNAFSIVIDVLSIKSTEGSIMNSKTYQALKAGKYPTITFTLTSPVKAIQAGAEGYSARAEGSLTVAGITRPVNIQAKISANGEGKIIVEGSQEINMSDYGIEPPTALMGMLKVKSNITIIFKTAFTANKI